MQSYMIKNNMTHSIYDKRIPVNLSDKDTCYFDNISQSVKELLNRKSSGCLILPRLLRGSPHGDVPFCAQKLILTHLKVGS